MARLAAWLFNIMLICEIYWEYVGLYSALIARGVVRAPSDSVFWWHEDTICRIGFSTPVLSKRRSKPGLLTNICTLVA